MKEGEEMMVKRGMTPQQARKLRAEKGIEETKLQKLRVKKGLSQDELAEKAGINKRTLQCYEQQTRPIDGAKLEVLCDICLALGCKLEDILENEDTIRKIKATK